jgi:hypothetical protein
VYDCPPLDELIALVLTSKNTGVDIFSSTLGLLDRPALFEKYIRRWIIEGYEEVERLRTLHEKKG